MNSLKCLFSDSGKLSIRRVHPHCRIEMKFCMVGDLQETVLRFEFHQNLPSSFGAVEGGNLPILVDLAIGLYKIAILQQIKEVIANAYENLNSL